MNFHNFTFINLCHPPTSPSDTFIFPNKSLLYFTSFCVCYLLSLTRVACESLDRKLFVEGWTHVQALHHWRRWQPFPRHNNCQHMGEASWALHLQWWNVGGPVLCRSWEGNHSCTEFECATAVLGPEDTFAAQLQSLWLFHSFCHLFWNVSWALEEVRQMPYLGLSIWSQIFTFYGNIENWF